MVTGMGVISPLGQNPAAFFENLLAGVSGVRRLPDEFRKRLSVTVAAPAAFDAARHFGEPRLRILDRVSQFAIVAAGQALSDSRSWSWRQRTAKASGYISAPAWAGPRPPMRAMRPFMAGARIGSGPTRCSCP